MRRLLLALSCLVVACGSGKRSSPTSATPPPPSNVWSVSGHVNTLDTGSPVGGASVTPGWSLAPVTTNAEGLYKLEDTSVPPSQAYPLTISADGMITRQILVNWNLGARTGVDASLIHDVPPFSMDFYRQLVRGMYDHANDGAPFAVLRWQVAPSFYIHTVDQNGEPIESEVVANIADSVRRAVPAWSSGQYTPAAIESGAETRANRVNWINIEIHREPAGSTTVCGSAQVGANPGNILLNAGVCGCSGVPGTVVTHEVGHAMGFFHVEDSKSTMYPFVQKGCGPGTLTQAEMIHSSIAYSRPRGNTDPDKDPTTASLSMREMPVEICPARPR